MKRLDAQVRDWSKHKDNKEASRTPGRWQQVRLSYQIACMCCLLDIYMSDMCACKYLSDCIVQAVA